MYGKSPPEKYELQCTQVQCSEQVHEYPHSFCIVNMYYNTSVLTSGNVVTHHLQLYRLRLLSIHVTR